MKLLFNLAILFSASAVSAASGGGHGGDHHIPWNEMIIPQIVNFTIFASVLIYLLKGPVVNFFAGRGDQFAAAVKRAEETRLTAEKTNNEIKTRLQKLEQSSKASVDDAKKEAALLREKIIGDAKDAAHKVAEDANKTSQYELERALAALRMELVNNSVKIAEDEVRTKASPDIQAQLETEFLKKVEGVRA